LQRVAAAEPPHRGKKNPGEARRPEPNGQDHGTVWIGSGRPETVTSPRWIPERGAIVVGERKAIATNQLLTGVAGRRAWKH
jgi:hypothetical protein